MRLRFSWHYILLHLLANRVLEVSRLSNLGLLYVNLLF